MLKLNSFLRPVSYLKHMANNNSTSSPVLFERVNQVGLITLNRPKQLNALNLEMVKLMQAKLNEWERDDKIKMVLVKGASGKPAAFCAGGDIKSMRDAFANNVKQGGLEFLYHEYILDHHIANLAKPYVALLNGITMGGGVGISVHSKYRVATENTLFAMPETAIGFFPDVGGSYFLPRLRDNLGMYLALAGNRLKGADIKRTGIATHYVKDLEKLEKEFLSSEIRSSGDVDSILSRHDEKVDDSQFDTSKIKKLYEGNSVEEIIENLSKDGSDWAKKQLELFAKMSPLSVKVSFKQLQLGAKKSLKECLEMEYQMGWRFAQKSDFVEGVRVVLVDKGAKPNWNPPTLQQVTQEQVDWFFSQQPGDDKLVIPESKL